jgi:hypothetical protein
MTLASTAKPSPLTRPAFMHARTTASNTWRKILLSTFSPDGSRIVTASQDKTARIWDAHLEAMDVKDLLAQACARLAGVTELTREEMRLAGYPESMPRIDVCKE